MSFIGFPPSQLSMEHEQHMHPTLQHTYLKHTWNSPLICCMPHHGPPHIEKEIHAVVNGGRVGDTSGSCVPPEWTRCRVPSLRSASPLFSLFSEGWERWASSLWSPHSHSCFSHASNRGSLKIPIPVCFFPLSVRFYFILQRQNSLTYSQVCAQAA